MKIIIPVLGFGPYGGMRVLSYLANGFIDKGHNVTFLCIDRSSMPYFPTKAEILWVNRKGLVNKNNPKILRGVLGFLNGQISLYKGLNIFKNEFDVVLANQSFTALPVFLSKIKAKKYYYIQAYEPETMKFGSQIFVVRFFLQLFSFLSYYLGLNHIVNAPLYMNYRPIYALDYVLPGIDFKIFNSHNREKNDIFTIGCIGRIEPNKGTKDVFSAYNILKNKGEKVKLKMAFGSSLAVPDGTELVIPQGDVALSEFYRSLDVLIAVATIQLNAVHYPVVEAMACGTPVITTGFLPASPINSWIVPINNPEKIAAAIKEVMLNRKSAYRKANIAKMGLDIFSWDNVVTKMLDLFFRDH